MQKRKVISSLSALCVGVFLTLLIVSEKDASIAAREALSLVVSSVLPSLFPYMIVSSLIISLDLLEPVYSLIPTEKLFSLPRVSAQIILCGLLCGFPIGAAGAARLYADGKVSRSEAERICAISSHTSPAFLAGAVSGWWGSKAFGLFLFVAQIVFAVISGTIWGRHSEKCTSHCISQTTEKNTPSQALCSAISDASLSCLAITGYIVFFRVMSRLFSSIFPAFSPVFMTTFEFSTGAHFGAAVGGAIGAMITGFSVGFSGLAVFMQCLNFTDKCGISMKPYLISKLCEGAFLAVAAYVYACIFPLSPSVSTFSPYDNVDMPKIIITLCILLLSFFVSSYCRKRNYFPHRY